MKTSTLSLLLLLCLTVSCRKDVKTGNITDLSKAQIRDFEFDETEYLDITIVHPQVINGAEAGRGEIDVLIPKGNTQRKLTPKISNFNKDEFIISPALGTMQDFSNGIITYTITSKRDPQKKVHYDVTVVEDQETGQVEPRVLSFLFTKNRNPNLVSDIEASEIIHEAASLSKIYIYLPPGTDFSQLNATVNYQGTALYYLQDPAGIPANSTTAYPAAGLSINYKYPASFFLNVRQRNQNKTYEVIADVREPLEAAATTVTTHDLVKGGIHSPAITTIKNVGNHPFTVNAIQHIDRQPAALNAIHATVGIPAFGLKPGESAVVSATVNATVFPPGSYQVTAVLKPALADELNGNHAFIGPSITIKTKIVD